MNIHQIQHFLQLKKYEHMATAADFLNISQPALSKSIAALEEELGVKLFDRVGRGIRINRNGEIFADYAEKAITLLEQGSMYLSAFCYEMTGSLDIVCYAYAPIITGCVGAYAELNPYLDLRIIQGDSREKDTRETMPDFYLCSAGDVWRSDDARTENWESLPILRENFVLIVGGENNEFDWPESGTQIDLSQLKEVPFLTMALKNVFFNDITFDLCRKAGFVPKVKGRIDDLRVKVELVRWNVGVAFIPQSCLADSRALYPELRYYTLPRGWGSRVVYLLHPKESHMTEVAKDFLEFARDYFTHSDR